MRKPPKFRIEIDEQGMGHIFADDKDIPGVKSFVLRGKAGQLATLKIHLTGEFEAAGFAAIVGVVQTVDVTTIQGEFQRLKKA